MRWIVYVLLLLSVDALLLLTLVAPVFLFQGQLFPTLAEFVVGMLLILKVMDEIKKYERKHFKKVPKKLKLILWIIG